MLVTHNALDCQVFSSAEFFWNIGEFGEKNNLAGLRTANGIQFFVAKKGDFSVNSFSENVAAKGNCCGLFLCISLKLTLSIKTSWDGLDY